MTTTKQVQAATAGLVDMAATVPGGTPCRRNPVPFRADTKQEAEYAKKLCGRCPLLFECRAIGFDYRLEGIWGGMDEDDREHANRSAASARNRAKQLAKRQAAQHTLDDTLFGLAS